jgi:hypothetical protein
MVLSIHRCAWGFSLGPEVTIEEAVIGGGAAEIVDFDRTGGLGRKMDL